MASLLPDEVEDGETIPDSSVSESFRSCLARYSLVRMGCRLFPLSLNALEEAVDPLNTHEDPDNVMVYPTLLLTTALLNCSLLSLFRELRIRAKALNKGLEHQVRIMWFHLCEIAYKRRRQAHIDSRTASSGLTHEQELALFDALTGASVEFRS